jgi:hypothetical protein
MAQIAWVTFNFSFGITWPARPAFPAGTKETAQSFNINFREKD